MEFPGVDVADGLTLAVGSSAQDVDDLLLAGAQPFHGVVQDVGVAERNENARRQHRRHILQKIMEIGLFSSL